MTAAAGVIQAFFTERLARQRQASPHTVAAYRDTIRMLLAFASARAGKPPSRLDIADLDAPAVSAFLDHLQHDRGNSDRTRNARLAAVHSLFGYAALLHPEHSADIERVLAIPPRNAARTIVTYLTSLEADALLAAPDPATRTGRRDHAWMLLAIQTGLRASELTGLARADVRLGTGPYVACHGKGRKDRITPLQPATATAVSQWMAENGGQPGRTAVHDHPRRADEQRRAPAAADRPLGNRCAHLPDPGREESHPACPETHRGDAAPARRERHHRHRALAGP